MKTLMRPIARIAAWFDRPRDTIRGFAAIRARAEILRVRRRHNELLSLRLKTGYGSAGRGRLTAEIDRNTADLDRIEAEYFG